MSEPFISEIRMMGFNFAPKNWAKCDGAILPIAQNQTLFALIGANYGGDGRSTFALPDFRGRTPVHIDDLYSLGSFGGQEVVTLSQAELAQHNHSLAAVSEPANRALPVNNNLGNTLASPIKSSDSSATPTYSSANPNSNLNAESLPHYGGSQAHNNMQPYLAVNFCISLQGVFPSRN